MKADSSGQNTPDSAALFWLPVWTLMRRELVRFFRQRTRVIGALGQPVVFWVLFGAGLHGSFQAPDWAPPDLTYQEYFFPGIAVLIVMFTAIFSTISIIEDRREGFLQAVLVAPLPRTSLVLGKVCGGSVLAVVQAGVFLLLGPALNFVGLAPSMTIEFSLVAAVETLLFLTLLAFALTALGYLIAWPLDSTQGFHAIMSIFLLPMWLLSGAFFPGGDSAWLAWIIRLNPMTYGVAGLRRTMYADHEWLAAATESGGLPSLTVCVAVTLLFGLACLALSVWLTRRRTSTDTR